jgi:hypothetical protein
VPQLRGRKKAIIFLLLKEILQRLNAHGLVVQVLVTASATPPSAAPDKWVVNDYPAHYETTNLRASFE